MPRDDHAPPSQERVASWHEGIRAGTALINAGKPEAAIPRLRHALAQRPDHAATCLSLGAALLRARRPAEALEAYNTALKHAPLSHGAFHGRALALHRMGDRDGALVSLRCAVGIDPDAWQSWRSIADITPNEEERLSALTSTASALQQACRDRPTDNRLFRQCVQALIDTHAYDDAARLVSDNFDRIERDMTAHDLLARIAYRDGRFEAAFAAKQRALRAMRPDDVPDRPRPNPFVPDAAVAALSDVWDIMQAAGLDCFLAAGTLLGFHRNGGPLPHDRDVDIGVMAQAGRRPDLARIIREHPDIMPARDARPGDRYFALMHKGVGIDLFVHEPIGHGLLCGVSDQPGDIQWRFTPFGLAETVYAGRPWNIPNDPERYLAESYGPLWPEPDTGFASAISSPALHRVDPFARAYYAAARAKAHLHAGDRVKATALLDQSPVAVQRLTFLRPRSPHGDASNAGGAGTD